MKIKEMQKRTGLKLAAIIVIGGVLMFTFTGCGNKTAEEVPVMSEAVVEMAEEGAAVAGGLYAEDAELGIGQEAEVAEEYTIDFVDAGNEDIVAESGSTVAIPEYEASKLIDIIEPVFEDFDIENELDFNIVEETENEDGSTTYIVALNNAEITNNCTTQYSTDSSGKAKAIFVYQAPEEVDVLPENFGLNFEVCVDKDGKVTLEKIVDIFGSDCSDITVYRGDCIGWSLEKDDTVTFEFEDEIAVSQNLNLYPVMDMTYAATEKDDITTGGWLVSYNGTIIKMGKSYEGMDMSYVVEDGKLVSTDDTKQVDPETGEVTDKPTPSKPQPTQPVPQPGGVSENPQTPPAQDYGAIFGDVPIINGSDLDGKPGSAAGTGNWE